jgi:general secretion pathway protein A
VAFEREKTIVDLDDVYEAAQGMGLSKEIFHYIVRLNAMERKKEIPSTNDSIKEPKTLSREPILSFGKETAIDKKSLKKPILFLLLSIVTLILSIFFYCQRSGYHEPMTCLQELLGF